MRAVPGPTSEQEPLAVADAHLAAHVQAEVGEGHGDAVAALQPGDADALPRPGQRQRIRGGHDVGPVTFCTGDRGSRFCLR